MRSRLEAAATARADLLQATLEYASSHVAFYRRLFDGSASNLQLSQFPLTTRELIAERLEDFTVLDRFPDYVVTSGGTTGSPVAATFLNADEFDAAYRALSGPLAPSVDDGFTIDVFTNSNGYYWRKPIGANLLAVPIEQPSHAALLKHLLIRGLTVSGRLLRAHTLHSQLGLLRTLTGYFVVTDFTPRDHHLKTALVYGGHTSKAWKARFVDLWASEILAIYGLSEVGTGNAMPCLYCQALHYWTAWPEFLDLDDGSPVQYGDALLVLTVFVPFGYVQPRIRYVTADVVTLLGVCEHTGLHSFVFRGRQNSSVIGPSTDGARRSRVMISEREIVEVLDSYPASRDIHSRTHVAEIGLWRDSQLPKPPFNMGLPVFSLPMCDLTRQDRARLSISINFAPSAEVVRSRRLVDFVQEQLFGTASSLDQPTRDFLRERLEITLTQAPPDRSRFT